MGIPVIGCSCPVCCSGSSYNRRLRSSALLKVHNQMILIDAGPDFRSQALQYQIDRLDGVLFTHAHYDHTAGIDELRAYRIFHDTSLSCLLSEATADDLAIRYHYILARQTAANQLTAKLVLHPLHEERGSVSFLGMKVKYMTFTQAGMPVTGFRFGNLAYISDIKNFPETIFEDLEGVETLVLSALRDQPSPLHFSISDAIAFAQKTGAKKTWLMHIAHEVDHEKTNGRLPENIQLAFDGLSIPFTVELVTSLETL